jgi:uncharacterized protein
VKYLHEFRDPVHNFITVTSHERLVVDSAAVQRLRHISQLALTSFIYPGATHKRFEHSLGVMHLAGEAFDVLTRPENTDKIKEFVPELNATQNLPYWKSVVRMAALCHDLGHLPFSHAAEHETLPNGFSHETLSEQILLSAEMRAIFGMMVPPIAPEMVAKLAVGPEKSGENFGVWEAILSDIITGNAFGVDRTDYLLRDSLHAGVAYGRFDHLRLVQTLRLLTPVQGPDHDDEQLAPTIGVEIGGLNSAEALLLARYFMFGQVYFHPVRVAYDIHLVDFLKAYLPDGKFSVGIEDHLSMTDNEIWVAIRQACSKPGNPAYEPARRIFERDHFKVLYTRTASDLAIWGEPGKAVSEWASHEYGVDAVRHRKPTKSGGSIEFPVLEAGGTVASSLAISEMMRNLPPNASDLVFIRPDLREDAIRKLNKKDTLREILEAAAAQEAQEEDADASEAGVSGGAETEEVGQ